jgi:putative membrane protein
MPRKSLINLNNLCAATLALGCAFASLAHAQGEAASGATKAAAAMSATEKLSPSDQQFIQDAGQAGATEIAASKLALSKSSDPQVKRFAQRMIADHAKLARNLDILAKRHGITAAPSADSAVIGSLQNLQGAEFDKAYIEKVVGGHQKAVELFKKESESGNDAQLKTAATRALPIVQHHYEMAQQLAKAKASA